MHGIRSCPSLAVNDALIAKEPRHYLRNSEHPEFRANAFRHKLSTGKTIDLVLVGKLPSGGTTDVQLQPLDYHAEEDERDNWPPYGKPDCTAGACRVNDWRTVSSVDQHWAYGLLFISLARPPPTSSSSWWLSFLLVPTAGALGRTSSGRSAEPSLRERC